MISIERLANPIDHRRERRGATANSGIPHEPGVITHGAPVGSPIADPEKFFEMVENRLADKAPRGALAYLEIRGPEDDCPLDPFAPDARSGASDWHVIIRQVGACIGARGGFCWYGGRFIVLVDQSTSFSSRQVLQRVSRDLASRDWEIYGKSTHLTPIIGCVELRHAKNLRALEDLAEAALDHAKSNLDIEPFLLVPKSRPRDPGTRWPSPSALWRRAPQWLVLSVQLAISLLIGLGGPFILYAVCDALGVDISGKVYIGVVIVLVITATTIWIEGLLALKRTEPPREPGSPYPTASIIIPAYLPNEAGTIVETLKAFLKLDYAGMVQIIVAYNTPVPHMAVEDELHALAREASRGDRFWIEPVRVVGSTSKAQNVNAVIGRVKGRFVGIFDADHHPHPDSLQRAWRWLSNGWDIVQGRCSIRNGTDSWVARMVAVEFEQIYAISHPGRARFHGFGIFGGSNGFWRTQVLHETRMRHSMLTEDIDSSIRAIVAGYKIVGDRDLVSEELAPTSMQQLLNQRLRWAQGWFQVSFRRVLPALMSPRVTVRQKLGLIHLLVWRELFPWYSIQVVPIMTYWVWVYGWHYIHWAVPIFLATTVYTMSTGPGQVALAYAFAQKPMRRRPGWFIEYLIVSTLFYSPFKDTLSRIAHIKEAMRERAWKVTPRVATPRLVTHRLAKASAVALASAAVLPAVADAQPVHTQVQTQSPADLVAALLGGEASTIKAARDAARAGRNAEAASLFEQAIKTVPGRRLELLREYADALTFAGRSAEAVPLYREVLSSPNDHPEAVSHLALALMWSGQYRAALQVYDSLHARTPDNADIAVHRARALAWLGQADAAVAALDAVVPAKWTSGPLSALGRETLVAAAREKSRNGQAATAAALFRRAAQLPGADRDGLLREYGEQVIAAHRPASGGRQPTSSAADLREMLSRTPPRSVEFRRTQRSLALALTAEGASQSALDAWTVYLRDAPGDADALVHQAALLARMRQNGKALSAFKAAYALDRQNSVARVGVIDGTVALARTAAHENRNADAASQFASLIRLAPERRKEYLREYADQLSFDSRAGEAIPLYQEVIANSALSNSDRKQAMVGLANAYLWAGHSVEGLASYKELARQFPDDTTLQLTGTIVAAREAARMDRNGEAAELFAKANAIAPERSVITRREYADQLTFSGQAKAAIPLYREVLAETSLAAGDRSSAQRGLALAYERAGEGALAQTAYTALVEQNPNDVPLRWKAYVIAAREAARLDRNKDAAELFARAIQLDPQHSMSILREYADQLSFTGRAGSAIGFYKTSLNAPGLNDQDRWPIVRNLAQALDWSGHYAESKTVYKRLFEQFPDDKLLHWHLLVVTAREAAVVNRNKDAAQLLAEAIALVPERRSELLKEYADKLTFSGNAKQGITSYRELLAQAHPAATTRDIELALALALSWNHKPDAALAEYRKLTATSPTDDDAALGIAQVLSWAGRLSEARVAYQQIIDREPGNAAAQRGLAQTEDWDGHHRTAQSLLNQRLQVDPGDLEARRLLAQSLVWAGRPDKALDQLHRAMQQQKQTPPSTPPRTQRALASGADLPTLVSGGKPTTDKPTATYGALAANRP